MVSSEEKEFGRKGIEQGITGILFHSYKPSKSMRLKRTHTHNNTYAFNFSTQGAELEDFFEFEASLIYIVSSRQPGLHNNKKFIYTYIKLEKFIADLWHFKGIYPMITAISKSQTLHSFS